MAPRTGKNLVDYAKNPQTGMGRTKVTNWKAPAKDGRGQPGNTDLSYSGKNPALGGSKGNGMDLVDGRSDKTYGSLNKPGDSTG